MALRRWLARGPRPPARLEGLLAALARDQHEAATAPPGPNGQRITNTAAV